MSLPICFNYRVSDANARELATIKVRLKPHDELSAAL